MEIGDLYRSLHDRLVRKPDNFGWLIPGKLAASARPQTFEAIEWLRKKRVTVILSLTRSSLPLQWVEQLKIDYYHIPIENHSVPSVEVLEKAVSIIRESLSQGKPIMVHCAAGQGRTGAVMAAYLVKEQDMEPSEAISMVRALRPGSIEKHQEASIIMYAKFCRTNRPKPNGKD